jgi:hypothetical protein
MAGGAASVVFLLPEEGGPAFRDGGDGGGWRWGGRVHTGDVCLYVTGRRFLY